MLFLSFANLKILMGIFLLHQVKRNYYYNIINKNNSNNRQLKKSYIYKYELLVYLKFIMIYLKFLDIIILLLNDKIYQKNKMHILLDKVLVYIEQLLENAYSKSPKCPDLE